ncbi:response regulator [Duganella sp. BJB488]|uniref:tetratricopeptide repeat-containing response regulator n=1 Tax=unclassified Duganella TaxID=2636909 RepID=UPI000E345E80|nr:MULTISPECIES: tetratricopeptide repeat-containing response regulator [unclassified Duganella]RFP13995.1 response regulator [Duganella sp. BJB489]RFP17420.1 response regulator [Duganella sp. BJB488]RFP31790.1 response regulator [Duganella sp. BJB480]
MSGVEAIAATAAEGAVDWAEKRYLLVDDFVGIRQLLRESLRNLGAKHIDQAASGGEAMMLLSKTRYDVVLCDYNLGDGKNGQQVLEEARIRNLMLPSSVWLMVSAEKSVESVMGAAEHQPDAYIIKPITEGVLLTRLNRVWNKKQIFREIDQAFADKDYLRAARLCDEQIAHDRLHEIDLLRMKATLLLKSGEPEQARKVYEQVLEERDYNWARCGLAKILMNNGELDAALTMFQAVITDNRFYIDAFDQLAKTYQLQGKTEEAFGVLEKAAKLSPNSVPRQRALGQTALKLGNIPVAEKAFRKCIEIGEYSVMKTVDAFFGLARVCAQKNDTKEAIRLLNAAVHQFGGDQVELRAKITEGLVYHETGDYRRARKSGDELEAMLADESKQRPDTDTCLDMATLLFAVGVKEAPVGLLCYITRNNHDNVPLLEDVQKIFDKARMTDEGVELIKASRKEAADMMNKGVLLWKTGKLVEAVEWMRVARKALPHNMRILFNSAQILISQLQQTGYVRELADEAIAVLMHVDAIAPGQQRFAQLMEQLALLAPMSGVVAAAAASEYEAANGAIPERPQDMRG